MMYNPSESPLHTSSQTPMGLSRQAAPLLFLRTGEVYHKRGLQLTQSQQ